MQSQVLLRRPSFRVARDQNLAVGMSEQKYHFVAAGSSDWAVESRAFGGQRTEQLMQPHVVYLVSGSWQPIHSSGALGSGHVGPTAGLPRMPPERFSVAAE